MLAADVVRERAFPGELPPFGVAVRGVLLPRDSGIDRRADALVVQRLDHLAEQVASAERRVNRADARRIVVHAVVALGEDRDAVHQGVAVRAGELAGVELAADTGDVRGGVKVEVNLTLGEGHGWRERGRMGPQITQISAD